MKMFFTLISAVLLMLPVNAAALSEARGDGATDPVSELVYHTAAPGINVLPRSSMSQMMVAYETTLIPREGFSCFRWLILDENGEPQALWTKWREFDGPFIFTKKGNYILEAFSETLGKKRSPIISVTFEVNYLGMTLAPGLMLTPVGDRGYNLSLTSLYGDDLYYRWKRYDDEVWEGWRLYTEEIPFTEAGHYVVEVNCEGDVMAANFEVLPYEYCLTGDVNLDGVVNILDATVLINMLLHNEVVSATGDVDNNGNVDINDVTALINMLLNQ